MHVSHFVFKQISTSEHTQSFIHLAPGDFDDWMHYAFLLLTSCLA